MAHDISASVTSSADCLHRLVEARLDRTPDDIVLVSDRRRVTGAALRRRAARLAGVLQARGVRPGGIVAVRVDDPVDRIATVLGVWQSGAAFLPVDPAHPDSRVDALLAAVEPSAVVVDEATWAARRPVGAVVPIGDYHENSPAVSAAVGPDDLAYLMPTSGSTGTAQLVAVTHRSVSNYLTAASRTYLRLGADSVVLQLAPFAFDPWLREVVGSLVAGATLVLPRRETQRDPDRVLTEIRRHGVTDLLAVVPSMVTALVRAPSFDTAPPALRSTLVSGESAASLHRHGARLRPFGRLVNQYGTTESTLVATWHERTEQDPPDVDIIGRPLPGVSVTVLDRNVRPVPPGAPGEICIGGPSLARGYWRDPAATARAFVPDPAGPPGARLVRTGDLGRWLPDGRLVHLGRMDRQVKVRGQRVDVHEVERALLDDDVTDAAVVGVPGTDADVVVVAYVVPRAGVTFDRTAARARLGTRLPAYAIPTYFVSIAALPLGANGKLDVAALPPPAPDVPRLTAANAPATALQRGLAGIWSGVLGLADLPIDANFFALGGHSLLAAQIVGRAREQLGVDLTVEQVLRHPTIAALADAAALPRQTREPAIERHADRSRAPLSPQQHRVVAQQRRYGLSLADLGSGAYIVALAYRLAGALDRCALRRAVDDIVDRHEPLRTVFDLSGEEPVAVLRVGVEVPVDVIDLTAVPDGDRDAAVTERVLLAASDEPFRLDVGPLLRIRLILLAQDRSVLVLAMHHIVSDGWSFGVFLHELSERYNAHRAGNAPAPRDLAVQYGDYARWQHDRMVAGRLEQQEEFWRERLRGLKPLDLPTDRPRSDASDRRGARIDLALTSALTRALHTLGRDRDATLHMVLSTGLAVLLAGVCQATDIAIGTPVANRTPHETEPLIGLFTNTLILRADLAAARTFADALAVVRNAAIEMYRNPDVAVERLIQSPDAPVRVLFVLQNAPLAPPRLSGVTTEPFPIPRHTTKYDLVFSIAEVRGGLSGYLEYRASLFDGDTAARLAAAWHDVLDHAVHEPTAAIADLCQHGAAARPDTVPKGGPR